VLERENVFKMISMLEHESLPRWKDYLLIFYFAMSFPVLRYFLDIFIFQVLFLSLCLSLSLSLSLSHTHTHTCVNTFAIAIRLLIPEEELVGCVL
jgi:hypothetical protein